MELVFSTSWIETFSHCFGHALVLHLLPLLLLLPPGTRRSPCRRCSTMPRPARPTRRSVAAKTSVASSLTVAYVLPNLTAASACSMMRGCGPVRDVRNQEGGWPRTGLHLNTLSSGQAPRTVYFDLS